MILVTASEGEEIIIDGHIRIRVLAIHPDEACFEVNIPEYLRSDDDPACELPNELSRWRADPP
jgi:hypothetical protein